MADFITIRGYAIPFNRTRYITSAGALEIIAPNAFDGMLASVKSVPILWGSHDEMAPKLAMATLHADDYGLAFSAVIDTRGGSNPNWGRLRAMVTRIAPTDQCSVNLYIEDKVVERRDGGERLQRVTQASIDHIAITSAAAYGTMTGVWPMHCNLSQAPFRIQSFAAQWEAGRAAWDARPKPRSGVPAQHHHGVTTNAKAAAALKHRWPHNATLRQRYAAAMKTGAGQNVVWMHAAFTRECGFDGDWNRLFAEARA